MIEPIADMIFALVTLLSVTFGGSVGLAIAILTIVFRLIMLPLTLSTAKRSYEQQQVLQRLQPEVERLQERYADNPDREASEILALHERHGDKPRYLSGLLAFLIQVSLSSGFFLAIRRGIGVGVRFLGIANLGNSSFVLALVVAALAYATGTVSSPQTANTLAVLLPVLIIFVVTWQVSAAMAVHWASSSVVSLLQSIWVQRTIRIPVQVDTV